jgi:hypothetical protein
MNRPGSSNDQVVAIMAHHTPDGLIHEGAALPANDPAVKRNRRFFCPADLDPERIRQLERDLWATMTARPG